MTRLRRPAEGWLAIVLVAVMAIAIGWSLDDPGWVLSRGDWTDFLPFAALAGVAVGLLSAKVRWPLWLAHLVGASFAALILPIVVGYLEPGVDSPGEAFGATANAVVGAWIDIAIRRQGVTGQTLHHLLAFGILAWGTGQAMSYAVFGHRRPLDAVVVGGLVLIVNLTMTDANHLRYLVIFTGAALFLLVTMHALDERLTWIRRRIGDPATISQLYLRGGTVFIVVAILGSLVLTDRAASAPLRGAMSGASDLLIDLTEDFQGLLPGGGDSRPGPVSFRGRSAISGLWVLSDEIAFTATLPPTVRDQYYRAGTWDKFVFPTRWDQTEEGRTEVPVAAGGSLADEVADVPPVDKSREIDITITPVTYPDRIALGPGTPLAVSVDARVRTLGNRNFQSIQVASVPYTLTTILWETGPEDLNGAALRGASDAEYPEDVVRLYTGDWQQAIPQGGAAERLRDEIVAAAASSDPYDIATAFERAFRDTDEFTYDADVVDLRCELVGIVECFATERRGYCMHFATSMTLMLRSLGIPTRLAQGFLPGNLSAATGIDTVRNTQAHAWVEVYFPGWGWHAFDPTGGLDGTEAQSGALVPGPSLAPGESPRATPTRPDERSARPTIREPLGEGAPGGQPGRTSDPAMLIVMTVLLLLVVGSIAAVAWWRGPRGEVTPDLAWRTIGRLAGRLGFAPRPTQTVYEFAGSLGDVIPLAREDLQTVARAKVEVVYARQRLSNERLRLLREANRRLRVTLLRLLFRRRRRRGVRGLRG